MVSGGFPKVGCARFELVDPNQACYRLKIEPRNLATGQQGEPGYYPVASSIRVFIWGGSAPQRARNHPSRSNGRSQKHFIQFQGPFNYLGPFLFSFVLDKIE